MSGKVLPLRKLEPAPTAPPSPWALGEVFTHDGVDYELVTAGEIKLVEVACGKRAAEKTPKAVRSVLDLLHDAGALVGDHVLVLRPTRPA